MCKRNYTIPSWQVRQSLFMEKVKEMDFVESELSRFYSPQQRPTLTNEKGENVETCNSKEQTDALFQLRRRQRHVQKLLMRKRYVNCVQVLQALNATLTRYKAARNDVLFSYKGLVNVLDRKLIKYSNRTKRAWIDISPIAETIFGLAQAKHVRLLQRIVEHLFENQHQLANDTSDLFNQLSMLANITTRRIDNVWKQLEEQAASVTSTFNELNKLKYTMQSDILTIELGNQYLHDWSNYHLTYQDRSLLLQIETITLRNKISEWTRSLVK